MIFNLLDRISPDNITDGYGSLDLAPIMALLLSICAIVITIISASLIYYFWKRTNSETLPYKKGVGIGIIIVSVILITLFIIFAYVACKS